MFKTVIGLHRPTGNGRSRLWEGNFLIPPSGEPPNYPPRILAISSQATEDSNIYRLPRCRLYYGILGTVKGAGIRSPSIGTSPLYDFRQRAVFEQPLVGRKSYVRRPHAIWNIIWSRLITYSHA